VEFTTKDDESKEDDKRVSRWTAHTYGSSTKNAGGIGIILKSPEGDIIKQVVRLQYTTTNNEAEYEALLTGLKMAKILGANVLDIHCDSQLVVGQVNGDYEAKEEHMQRYLDLVRHQMNQFQEVKLKHIP
jgi:ribonuclease HI